MCDNQCTSLRTGITTGTCAAGAAKACAIFLRDKLCPEYVSVKNLEGHEFILKTFRANNNFFGVVKYSGDDKCDITDGVKVLACVEILDNTSENIMFSAGEGVGTVTLPGLKIPPGEPAINPVPRKMIGLALREILPRKSLRVTISIPGGEELTKKTFNPRLGIIGGLSVLGTTGIVKPMNERALLDSLSLEMNMIYSLGFREIYITFAGTGEKFLREIFCLTSRNVIQAGNYAGHVLDEALRLGFSRAVICGHPGKLLKIAAGNFNTHSRISDGRLEALCTHLALMGAEKELIRRVFHSNTTNEAIYIVNSEGYGNVWNNLAKICAVKCRERTCNNLQVDCVFIDSNGKILGSFYHA